MNRLSNLLAIVAAFADRFTSETPGLDLLFASLSTEKDRGQKNGG